MTATQGKKLKDILHQIDPKYQLDPIVEELLLEMANDFIDQVTSFSIKLAKHRRSTVLESQDVLYCLEKNWNINIPGSFVAKSIKANSQTKTNAFGTKPTKGSVHFHRLDIKKHSLQRAHMPSSKTLANSAPSRNITPSGQPNSKTMSKISSKSKAPTKTKSTSKKSKAKTIKTKA